MYHDLISRSTAFSELTYHEREPPMPLGEPTALNKERVGKSTEARQRRTGTVRGRSSW